MTKALDELVSILDLEAIEVNIFRGHSPAEERQRVFGGQVAGQALVAAGRTVERGDVHSLHGYFLRPGDPSIPILYEVDRIRDGRSFTTRRVVAIQHGAAIFNLSASFHLREEGLSHQLPMPDVPPAESLPTLKERLAPFADTLGDWIDRPQPIEQRYVDEVPAFMARAPREARQRIWIRADGELGDDPLLNACVVAYASDMSLLDTVLLPHDIVWYDPALMGASIDHCMWFHRPFRADRWLLYDHDSPWSGGARGLARGSIFTAEGDLAVSVVQEGLVRLTRPPSPG